SRRFGSTTTGRVGGNCSISAVHLRANRVLPTSKIILSLTTSSAARRFGNSMTPCIGCGPSCAALLFPPGPLFLAASFRTATGPRFLPFRILAISVPPRCCRTIPPLRHRYYSVVRTPSATVIHDSVKVGLGDCSSALATITAHGSVRKARAPWVGVGHLLLNRASYVREVRRGDKPAPAENPASLAMI